MPRVYLSPSLQEFNLFINGGTEEEYVNLIADAMEPYLFASGIEYARNDPNLTLSEMLREVNKGDFDVYFSIHTNAAPPFLAGKLRGPEVFYYAKNPYGKELAEGVGKNLGKIYPNAESVKVTPTIALKEISHTTAPAALVKLGYNDTFADAEWIKDNVRLIAKELSRSLTEYFAIFFVEPELDEIQ
ncbi:N-acetylmuramoyl-L-alanine amidase [Anaerotignum neopropionicum]|uniref:N-acetylmuramoyl-L-alanine amidase n=1 Tax=Anaerotignum neopropionicum TaxID=36847 RepID=A0A136WES6_9FIRM|nr:N-acetylmuramoyl-L-alanine amidase [Anaerotignum neopropionicum]KXL53038.1 N-acetylmuramoyl-L-alanine amidase [Anaerotignum neopropionicum]